ncbi:MAG: hypothetical protein PVI78_12525, partial [Anaerolineales bacterium]
SCRNTTVFLIVVRKAIPEGLGDIRRSVCGPIINNDDLNNLISLLEDTFDGLAQKRGAIEDGDNDTN